MQSCERRPGSCLIGALVGAVLAVVGGSVAAIAFMGFLDWADLDADERLPRGGPGDVLMKPVPDLAEAKLAGPPLREQAFHFAVPPTAGWEQVYRTPGGELTVHLEADRHHVRELVLPRPAKPVNWEGLAARLAWGPPASTTGTPAAQVSRWRFPAPHGHVDAVVRWHGARPGVVDEVRWTLGP